MVDESDLLRPLRRNVITRHNQLQRSSLSYQMSKSLRTTEAGNQAQIYLGLSEYRILSRDANMAGHRQFATAAQGKTVYGGNHRLIALLNRRKYFLANLSKLPPVDLIEVGHLRNVSSRRKCPVTFTRNNNALHIVVIVHFLHHLAEFFNDRLVEGVHFISSVERQRQDTIFQANINMLELRCVHTQS